MRIGWLPIRLPRFPAFGISSSAKVLLENLRA
jgi:hypothetical protein